MATDPGLDQSWWRGGEGIVWGFDVGVDVGVGVDMVVDVVVVYEWDYEMWDMNWELWCLVEVGKKGL